jgi:hypothetical protein
MGDGHMARAFWHVGQRKARASPVDERNEAAARSRCCKTERASLAAQGPRIEAEAAPIRDTCSSVPTPAANAPSGRNASGNDREPSAIQTGSSKRYDRFKAHLKQSSR